MSPKNPFSPIYSEIINVLYKNLETLSFNAQNLS